MSDGIISRRAWVAATLSVIQPGLGHVYAGQWRTGLTVLCAIYGVLFLSISFLGGWLIGFYAVIATGVLIWVACIAAIAIRIFRSKGVASANRPKKWHYLLFIMAAVGLSEISPRAYNTYGRYKSFHVPAGSMMPNIELGDVIVARRFLHIEEKRQVTHGTIVVFWNTADGPRAEYVKRIAGVGGDVLSFKNGAPYIGETPLPQSRLGEYEFELSNRNGVISATLLHESNGAASYDVLDAQPGVGRLDNVGPYFVPENHLFMLGDNRDYSADSRLSFAMGYVPVSDLIGEACYILWSKDVTRIGKRFGDC
ncbi:MAG: signal peptidase I [Pseudomonadota bacterium]